MKSIESLFGVAKLIGKAIAEKQGTEDFLSDVKASGFVQNSDTLSFLQSFMDEKKHDFFKDYIKFKLSNQTNETSMQQASKIYDAIHGTAIQFSSSLAELGKEFGSKAAKYTQNLQSINELDYSSDSQTLSKFAHNVLNNLYERSGKSDLDDLALNTLSAYKKIISDSLVKQPAISVYHYVKDHVLTLISQWNTVNELQSKYSSSTYASQDELVGKLVDYASLYNTSTIQFLNTENNFIYNMHSIIQKSTSMLYNSVQECLSDDTFINELQTAELLIESSSNYESDKAEYLAQFEAYKSEDPSFKKIFADQSEITKSSLKALDFATIETLYKLAVSQNNNTLHEVLDSFSPKKDLVFSAEQELKQKIENPNTEESLDYCKYFYTTLLNEPQNPINTCYGLVKDRNIMIFEPVKSMYRTVMKHNQKLLEQNKAEQNLITTVDEDLTATLQTCNDSDEQTLDKTIAAYSNLLNQLFVITQVHEEDLQIAEGTLHNLDTCQTYNYYFFEV